MHIHVLMNHDNTTSLLLYPETQVTRWLIGMQITNPGPRVYNVIDVRGVDR